MTRKTQKTSRLDAMDSAKRSTKSVTAIVLSCLIITALSISPAGSASGYKNGSRAQDTDLMLSIDSLSPYVVANSPIDLTFSTAKPSGTIRIDILKATNTRSELFDFVDNLGKRSAKSSIDIPFSSLVSTGITNQFVTSIPVNTADANSLKLTQTGVYPVAISQVFDDDTDTSTQYSFITYVPTVSSTGSAYAHKLNVVPLIQYSPLFDLTKIKDTQNELTPYGLKVKSKMISAQQSLAAVSGDLHSVVISPEQLDNWNFIFSANNQTKSLFVDPATLTAEYIEDTYSPLDIAELEKQGFTRIYSDQMLAGRATLTKQGFSIASRTLVTASITPDTIETVARSGISNVIVDDVTFPNSSRPSTQPAQLVKNDSIINIATSDSSIEEHLPVELSSSAIANYMIAATSIVMLEAPSIERGFIVPVDLEKLDSITVKQFYAASKNSPLVSFVSPQTFFDQQQDNEVSKKLSKATYPKTVKTSYTKSQLDKIKNYSLATQSMFSNSFDQDKQAKWMRMAAFSKSNRKPENIISPSGANRLMKSVNDYAALPKKRTLTITSHENSIPVTIRNTSGKRIDVVIAISADKLSFPQGDSFHVSLRQENTTVHIPVKTRTSGSFPVTIQMLTPNKSFEVAQQNATVRSTFVSGIGIAIAIASTLFLAMWWLSHYKKSKKKPIAKVYELPHEKVS